MEIQQTPRCNLLIWIAHSHPVVTAICLPSEGQGNPVTDTRMIASQFSGSHFIGNFSSQSDNILVITRPSAHAYSLASDWSIPVT